MEGKQALRLDEQEHIQRMYRHLCVARESKELPRIYPAMDLWYE